MEKKQRADSDKKTERITVLFSRVEAEAIAKKAIALHIKSSQLVRLLTLKGLGAVQLNLFG